MSQNKVQKKKDLLKTIIQNRKENQPQKTVKIARQVQLHNKNLKLLRQNNNKKQTNHIKGSHQLF